MHASISAKPSTVQPEKVPPELFAAAPKISVRIIPAPLFCRYCIEKISF